ncbi:hypothetical protein HDK77DRAFT_501849 [Phyllosticta capitalensis]|uniref:Uncharacterized protein n=1 Tax=Phyllosticta capitalensis TaxID=121624 RepID=A0ABR1YBI2_9PEZI
MAGPKSHSRRASLSLADLIYTTTSLSQLGLYPAPLSTTTSSRSTIYSSSSSRANAASAKVNARVDGQPKHFKKSKSKGTLKNKTKSNAKGKCPKGKRKRLIKTTKASTTTCSNPSDEAPSPPSSIPAPIQAVLLHEYSTRDFDRSADALAAWMNARWAKTGYSVGVEAVAGVLGEASGGVGERHGAVWDGVFVR